MYRKFFPFFLVGFGFCFHVYAQQQQAIDASLLPYVILKNNTAGNIYNPRTTELMLNRPYAVKGILTEGITLHRRLSDSISIVSFSSLSEKDILLKNARILTPVNDRWKLSPDLLTQRRQPYQKNKMVSLIVSVTDIIAFQKKYTSSDDITITASDPATGALMVMVPANWIESAALHDPLIRFIAYTRLPFTERELTGFDLSANRVNMAHRNWPAVNGRGLTVSIKENKMDTADIDFRGRYLFSPAASSTIQTHATTMATIAIGGGNTYYTGQGVAWGASLSSADFSTLLPDNIQELKQRKVSVQNHSYGVGIENYYGADAAAYDAQLLQNPTLIHVFSAGNSGSQTGNSGYYAGVTGFANLTGSFKMAKNILTVGAIDSFGVMAPLSSHGPACDGRVKPELVAFGEDGSSGSAAIVSGIALLVQDAWQQKNGSLPTSAVTRSVLLNSADDIGALGIDFLSGYGSVNAWRALQTVAQNQVIQGQVANGQISTHTISLPTNARNLKLTLCWIDPPAQVNSFKTLVNDLDLIVDHPVTTQQWLPWVLNSNPVADSLRLLPVRKRDSLNNAEQVTIENPPPGNYQILVKGFAVTTAEQAYALTWQYDTLEHFTFTYPVKGDNIFPGQNHTIRWESTLPGTGILQHRLNNGIWEKAADNIDLSKRYYQWQAPDKPGGLQLRMLAGTKEWRTDTVSLSPNLLIRTGFNCIDSFLVYWQRAAVDSYRVYRLGPQYLEPLTTLTDTALIQLKQSNPYQYFTVAPVLLFNTEGVRSHTFNYTQQQVACYINGFIADPSGTNAAKLSLQLGTIYQLSKIVFEKLTANGFVAIRTITPVLTKEYTITEAANNGLNIYRAKIELLNGQVYYSGQENVLQFAAQPYYVFPNPVRQGSVLHLLADDIEDTRFLLYDLQGRKLAGYTINGFYNEIRLPLLQKGTYYYTIIKAGIRQVSQPLLVL